MINVLHLRDTQVVCGPGKTIMETALAVDPAEFRLSIGVFSAPGAKNVYEDTARGRGVAVHRLEARRGWDPRLLGQLVDLVRTERIDIVHSHDFLSDILTWALRWRVPVATMSTAHGFITNTFRSRAYITLAQRALRGLDKVIAVSEETRARVLAAGVPAAKVSVIHNAIVARNYRAADFERGVFRRRIGVAEDAILIGNIGRLSPEKGQKDTLLAAAPLAREDARVHVVFVGSGPDTAALTALAGELGLEGRVTFAGHMHDVRPVYRDLDALALTSYTEGFPNVVLEALCMDVPVLATDVGGVRELMIDGQTGLLVPPGRPDLVEAGLRRLVQGPADAARLAATGKQRVLDEFEFTARTRKEEAVYRELMHG